MHVRLSPETNWMEKFSRLCSRIGLNTSRLSQAIACSETGIEYDV